MTLKPIHLVEFQGKVEGEERHFIIASPPEQYVDYCNNVLANNKDAEQVDDLTIYRPQSPHPTARIIEGKAMLKIRKGDHIAEIFWNYPTCNINYVINQESK